MKYVWVVYGEWLEWDTHEVYNFGIYSNKDLAEKRLERIEKDKPNDCNYFWLERIQLNKDLENHEVTYL